MDEDFEGRFAEWMDSDAEFVEFCSRSPDFVERLRRTARGPAGDGDSSDSGGASISMGVVYRAREAGLDRLVAVKMVRSRLLASAAEVERFQEEARAVAVPPSRLSRTVPRDLESVCLKCIEKDPLRRDASAADLAQDLERFLASKPIIARRAGSVGRSLRWARRRPAAAFLLVLLATLAVALPAAVLLHNAQLRERAMELERESDLSRRSVFAARMHLAAYARQSGHISQARDLVKSLASEKHVEGLAFSPDGTSLISVGGRARSRTGGAPEGEALLWYAPRDVGAVAGEASRLVFNP